MWQAIHDSTEHSPESHRCLANLQGQFDRHKFGTNHILNVFYGLELAERVGFESTLKRIFNNIEGNGRHFRRWKYM